MTETDVTFSGSAPSLYDKYLGPSVFAPFVEDFAQRMAVLNAAFAMASAISPLAVGEHERD